MTAQGVLERLERQRSRVKVIKEYVLALELVIKDNKVWPTDLKQERVAQIWLVCAAPGFEGLLIYVDVHVSRCALLNSHKDCNNLDRLPGWLQNILTKSMYEEEYPT